MKTIKEIADICGVSKTSINRIINSLGIEKIHHGNKNLISDQDCEKIVEFYKMDSWERTKTQQNETQQTEQNATERNNRNATNETDRTKIEQSGTERNALDLMIEMLQKELDLKNQLLLEERKRVDDLNNKLADAYEIIAQANNQITAMGQSAQFITVADKTERIVENEKKSEPVKDIIVEPVVHKKGLFAGLRDKWYNRKKQNLFGKIL